MLHRTTDSVKKPNLRVSLDRLKKNSVDLGSVSASARIIESSNLLAMNKPCSHAQARESVWERETESKERERECEGAMEEVEEEKEREREREREISTVHFGPAF